MKYRPMNATNMWDYLHAKRMFDMFNQPIDLINSPFAFPRLPTRSNPPLGISNTGKIKDSIMNDKNAMMGRLFGYHEMYQRYASGLFNLTPSQYIPGHPLSNNTQAIDNMKEENERLKKENAVLKTEQTKKKK